MTQAERPNWARRIIIAVIALIALVLLYFVLSAFVPRWWSIQVGELSGQTFRRGIAWGLFFGLVSTLGPLLLALAAFIRRHKWGAKVIVPVALVLALALATPNLMTLTVVLGSGSGALAGQRIMDTEAPGFRGATAIGAIIAVIIFAALVFFALRYRRRGRELKERDSREPPKADKRDRRSEQPSEKKQPRTSDDP